MTTSKWDESKHKRAGRGSKNPGQFAPKPKPVATASLDMRTKDTSGPDDPECTAERLRLLAGQRYPDHDWETHGQIASHPNCPSDLMEMYALDDDEDVRFNLYINPNSPKHLRDLVEEEWSVDVRRRGAANPRTPPELLAVWAQDSDSKVRRGVAGNENTPFDIRRQLADERWREMPQQEDDSVLGVADLAAVFPSLVDGLGRLPGGISPDLMEALGDCIYDAPSRRNLKALEGYAVGDIREQLNECGAHPHPIDRFAGDGPSGAMEWDVSVLEVETGTDGTIHSDRPLRVAVAFGCRNKEGGVSPAFEAYLTLDYGKYFSGGMSARSLSWEWEDVGIH